MEPQLPVRDELRLGDCSLLYVSNPENTLDEATKNYLSDALQVIASRAFGREVPKDSIRRYAIANQTYLFLIEYRQKLVGFAGVEDEPESLSFLTSMAISPEQQGKGLGQRMLRHLMEISRCDIFAFTTQSPVMYCLLRKVSKVVYPGSEGNPISPEVRETGARIVKVRQERTGMGEFCPATFVSRDLYSRCLYAKYPWCADSQVNAFFQRMLRFGEDGTRDGFLLMGQIN